jgi:hypothetical protein
MNYNNDLLMELANRLMLKKLLSKMLMLLQFYLLPKHREQNGV